MKERDIYLAFALLDGIGPVRFKLLVEYFGSVQKAWAASKQDLIQVSTWPTRRVGNFHPILFKLDRFHLIVVLLLEIDLNCIPKMYSYHTR